LHGLPRAQTPISGLVTPAHGATPDRQKETVPMNALLDTVDPDGLLEYSVVFTEIGRAHV
jgi:hypothetical protein